jgi:hypothetical protein
LGSIRTFLGTLVLLFLLTIYGKIPREEVCYALFMGVSCHDVQFLKERREGCLTNLRKREGV